MPLTLDCECSPMFCARRRQEHAPLKTIQKKTKITRYRRALSTIHLRVVAGTCGIYIPQGETGCVPPTPIAGNAVWRQSCVLENSQLLMLVLGLRLICALARGFKKKRLSHPTPTRQYPFSNPLVNRHGQRTPFSTSNGHTCIVLLHLYNFHNKRENRACITNGHR